MRVLVSVDMEGIGGVVAVDELRQGEAEWERSRELMTAEANAAVRGVYAYDPDAEVLVSDAHGGFRNLLPERLDRRAVLLRGKPKPYGMLAGLDDTTSAVLYIGYHGKAGTPTSVLAHTIHGAVIADVRLDGRSVGEIGLNTALAAHHGAIPVLLAGDDTAGAEAREVAPGIVTVEVKRALGMLAAACLHPEEACARIEQATPDALANRPAVTPLRIDGPLSLEVDVHGPGLTEYALLIPGVERAGPRTLRYAAPDMPAAYRLVQLIAVVGQAST